MKGARRRRAAATALMVMGGMAMAARPCCAADTGCPAVWEAASGPLPGGTGPADFATIPDPCGLGDFGLRLRTALLVAPSMPDYYGSVVGGLMLRVGWALSPESWLSLGADLITYRYVNNGGLAGSSWSAGPPTIGYYRTVATSSRSEATAYGRLLLPLDSARSIGIEAGLELGASVRARWGRRVSVDGGLALTTLVDVAAGETHARLEPIALAEGWYAARPAAALALGFTAKADLAPDAALLTFAPRVTGRLALRRGFWLAALVEVPLVGSERTDLVASLFLGYRS